VLPQPLQEPSRSSVRARAIHGVEGIVAVRWRAFDINQTQHGDLVSAILFNLPVDLLQFEGKPYLVAPRGRTQWVRNVEASAEITLRKGSTIARYGVRALSDAEKVPILKAYLDSFPSEVQRFFPVAAGSPVEAFSALAPRYPAFELLPR